MDIIRVLLKDEFITIDTVPQLKKISTFHGVSRLFEETKFASFGIDSYTNPSGTRIQTNFHVKM